MSEPLVIQTLTQKRAEILGRIRAYEAQIAQAKHDLAHLNATMELFAAPGHSALRSTVATVTVRERLIYRLGCADFRAIGL